MSTDLCHLVVNNLDILRLTFPLAKNDVILLNASFHLKAICTSDGGIFDSKVVSWS